MSTVATKAIKPKKIKSTASKAKRHKMPIALEPTIQGLIAERDIVRYGFIYEMLLSHPRDPSNTVYNYIGSKSFRSGKLWTHYQSSSEYVHRMLDAGFVASYRIIALTGSKHQQTTLECGHIIQSWSDPLKRPTNRNHGLPLAGGAHMTRYMWLKSNLGIIDKWPY